jgi:hypothetical protein
MRICLTTTLLAIILTGAAEAQEILLSASHTLAEAEAQPAELQQRPIQLTARPAQRQATSTQRLSSMMGFIDDARIESKIRVRVDSAFRSRAPDRAEFFYAKCRCYALLPTFSSNFDPDAPGPRPGAVNDLDYNQIDIFGEWAFGVFSAFGQLPLRWIQPRSFIPGSGGSFPNQSGLGDLRLGIKMALVETLEQSLTAQAQFYAPTGDASQGLGTNHTSVEPALLYYRRLSDDIGLESQFGVWIPLDGSAGVPTSVEESFSGQVLNYGVGASFDVHREGRILFAPVVELVGWRVLSGFQTSPTVAANPANGINILDFKVGARVTVDGTHSAYAGFGHALTDATWYDDIVRVEYRFSF